MFVQHRFGGEVVTQMAFWTIATMTLFSAAMGIINVKKIRAHRRWMLREYHIG